MFGSGAPLANFNSMETFFFLCLI